MKKLLTILLLFLIITASLGQTPKVNQADLNRLVSYMTGEFSSEEQAKTDSLIFHIRLWMAPIWEDRQDGYWLYVEQAAAGSEQRPYRQRIYHLYVWDKETIASRVFEIPDALTFAGGWQNTSVFDILTPDELIDRQGCTIFLKKTDQGHFHGTTPGKECLSSLRGASYATSEATIMPDRMITWDRGWNDAGELVWGSAHTGYVFIKK